VCVATLVPADLVHPHINHDYICHRQTKEGNLFFEYFFLSFTFRRIKPFGIDEIKIGDVLEPNSLGTSFAILLSVEDRESGPERVVHKSGFACGLGAKYGDTCCCIGKLT
jgi:hypothetical protein